VPAARAALIFNEKVFVTFDQPVEMPNGNVLSAGKRYMFTITDEKAGRQIVQIFSQDKS